MSQSKENSISNVTVAGVWRDVGLAAFSAIAATSLIVPYYNSLQPKSDDPSGTVPAQAPAFIPEFAVSPPNRAALNLIGASMDAGMRADFEVCARETLTRSDFFRYVSRKVQASRTQIDAAFTARTAVCIRPRENPAQWIVSAAKLKQMTALMPNGIAAQVADELGAQKKTVLTASPDTQAFNLLLNAMFTAADRKWQAADFVYLPSLNPDGARFTISYQDRSDIARVCEAEAGIIDRYTGDAGIESCAAVVKNRLATGRFGHTVRAIMLTGGFDAIRIHGKGKIEGLPRPKADSIAKVNAAFGRGISFNKAVFYANDYFTKRNGHCFSFQLSKVKHVGDNGENSHDLMDARHLIQSEVIFDPNGRRTTGHYPVDTVLANDVPNAEFVLLPQPAVRSRKEKQRGHKAALQLAAR